MAAACRAADAATLSMSIGSECPTGVLEDPEEVNEDEAERLLGVEAAVDAAELLFEADVEVETELAPLAEALFNSGRLALIQGWFNRSLRVGRSLGRTFRHRRIMSWHSCVRRARNRTSALQMASSFS